MKSKHTKSRLPGQPSTVWPGAYVVLIILAVVVLLLMFIAWAMPAATPREQEATVTLTYTPEITGTPKPLKKTPTPIPDPTPENVGYSNGIIVLSAVISLILLLAAIRELGIHRRISRQTSTTPEEKDEHDESPG